MKTSSLIKETKDSLYDKVNPLGFMQENGFPMSFVQPFESYYYLLCKVGHECPQGYLESTYILTILYPAWDFATVKRFAYQLADVGFPYVVDVMNWETDRGKNILERLAKCLHIINETRFNSDAFNYAYDLFRHSKELSKLKT